MMGLQTIAQGTADIATPNMALIISYHALTPLMLLTTAFAIVAASRARKEKHRWLPIACGGVAIAVIVFQLLHTQTKLYDIIGSTGMGYPEEIALLTFRFLGVAFVGPIVAIPALYGLSAAAFRKSAARIFFGTATWIVLLLVSLLFTNDCDRKLSVMLGDSRTWHEEELWELQCDTYATTLKSHGVIVSVDERDWDDIALPRDVITDIRRETFLDEFPPPSILKKLLTNSLFLDKEYSDAVRAEVFEKHRAACEAEGIRLASERLERERKD